MLSKLYKYRIQIFRFVVAGAVCAVIEIVLFRFLTLPNIFPAIFDFENAETDYPISNFVATGTAIVINYYLSIRYVFEQGKHSQRREFVYFVVLSLLTLIVSWRIFAFFSNHVIPRDVTFMSFTFSHLVINKIIAIGITSLLNYAIKKKVVFEG